MSVWRAASEGNAKQLSDLLRSGKAGFNITNTLGQTPLHVAVIAGQAECVSVLLADPSLDVNRRDTDLGWTPLHYAIFRKYPRIAVMLAARGAEIDVLDHKGFSPVDLTFVDTYPPPREEIATTRSSASAFDLASLLEEEAVQHKRSPKADEVFGELFTWGEGSNYCLGHGNPNSVSQPKRVANPVLQDDSVVQVSTSDFSTGVVTRSGRLYTFGVGTGGRLGHGDTEIRLVPKRVVGPLLAKRVVCVSMGFAHSAAVADDGSVFTWGSGAFGQLGHGSTEDSLAPRKIRSAFEGQKPIAVAAGRQHTAVLTSKGSVWTFGCGENGELGYLTDALAKKAYCQCTPRQVVGVEAPVVAIAAGKAHTACTTQAGDVYLLGFGSPQARKLFLPAIMPSAFAAYQQQAAAAAAASSSSSPSRVLPTPVYSISPSQTSFSLLAGDALSASPSSMAAGGSRGQRLLTSLVASGNMTLVVFNRRDVFLSDLYHVDGLHSRIPKPIYIPAIPGNNTIASAALNTNKEIIVATDAGHLWKCVENKEKAREWVWSRISVGRRFSHVACSRNHYAAIGQKEALVKERIDVSPWSLSAHLLKELENDDFTDVEFVMDDGRRVPAHKIVLAMRSRHFASLFATQEEEEEGAEDAAPPVWGESDYFVPGLAPKRKREVAVDQTTYPLFHNFIRLVYTDASDPSTARLTESEKGQVTPLVKRFGVNSLNPSSRDKARSKGKERVVDTDDTDDASREASRPPTPDVVAAPSSSSRFEKELGAAYHDERLTDVDLISSEEDRIACHQVILCSQSEVFRTMMTIGMIESQKSEIFIQNASTETLRKVKEFLYLGNFADLAAAAATVGEGKKPGAREAIPFNTVMELLNISNQFMLRRMKETLEDLLLRQYLDYDNLVSLLITAENYSCHNLKRQLFEFARRNFIALLQGNVVRDLLDHPDYAYLLDDLDYFVQSGGKLRDVDAGDDDGTQAGDTAEEAEQRQAEVDELLTYFSEDEIEHQKQMEAFWERERLIEKEREKQKANEQRRRAAKAHAKFAAKARRGKAARPAAAASKPKAKDDGPAETATSTSTTTASTTTTVEEVEEDPRRAQLRRSVEAANKALGKEYGSNEEALRIVKRLRASKKKLSQIDNLLEKQAKGDELDEDQRAKLDHQQTLEDEIAALLRQLAEATRPPPPAPKKKSAPQSAPAEPAPAPVGPVAYQKKRDNDDFVSGKAANRNRRRTNSATKAVKAEATTPAQPTPTTTQPAMATVAAPPAPSLAPWAAMKKPAPAAAGAPSPQKAKSLVQIQQEEAAQEMRRRKEAAARGKPAGPATAGTGAPQPQHRTIKRLDGSVEKAIVGQPAPRTQVGGADNDSSSSSKYSISLAIGGKSASSPVRVTMPGVPVQHHQASTTASASSNGGKHAMPALRSSSNGLENSSASRPAAASAAGAAAQQSPSRSAAAAAFPPLGASPQRAPSLADIQREERERVEAERKRREVVKPTKKPLKQIQEEQEEARKIQALFGEELKQIYGHDVDLESIW